MDDLALGPAALAFGERAGIVKSSGLPKRKHHIAKHGRTVVARSSRGWRQLSSEAAGYTALRLLSGLMSFALFALIARWYAALDVKALYYFLFLAGFFISALRIFTSLAAGLQGHERRTEKLRRAHAAYARVGCVAVLLLPVVLWTLADPAVPFWALGAMAMVVLLCGFDTDLLRALVGRGSVTALLAVGGGLSALVCLTVWRSPQGAYAAVLLQWLPMCIVQAAVAWRLRHSILAAVYRVWLLRGRGLVALLGVVLFDGLVINVPFLLDLPVPPEVGVSIGVATRLFVSCIMLLPLLLYWSNGGALSALAKRMGTTAPLMFWCIAMVSGLLAGGAFAMGFALLAGQPPSPLELAAAAALLTGYAAYATISRYRTVGASTLERRDVAVLPGLTGLAVANVTGAVLAMGSAQPALALALVQGSVLLAAAAWLLALRASSGPGK